MQTTSNVNGDGAKQEMSFIFIPSDIRKQQPPHIHYIIFL